MRINQVLFLLLIPLTLCRAQENPPVIEFIYPHPHQQLTDDTLYLKAGISDPDGDVSKLEFIVNDSILATISSEPWEYLWESIPGGYYYLIAKVYDDYGYVRYDEVQIAAGNPEEWRPHLGYPLKVPGRIEAEYFDNGGPGVGYQEAPGERKGCTGTKCRPYELVDIQPTGDEIPEGEYYNYMISHTFPGDEWLEYSIECDSSAWFIIRPRIATDRDYRTFHFELDGQLAGDTLTSINTSVYNKESWYSFQQISSDSVYIEKGIHILRLVIHPMSGNSGGINFNFLDVVHPDFNPPLIYFTEPVNPVTKKADGTDLTFSLEAADHETSVDSVQFFKNGNLIKTWTEEPYETVIPYESLDPYLVSAIAWDTHGNPAETLPKQVIFIDTSTDVPEKITTNSLPYPNPCTYHFKMDVDDPVTVTILDVSGRILRTIEDYEGEEIATGSLSPGTFLIRLDSKSYSRWFRLLKQ